MRLSIFLLLPAAIVAQQASLEGIAVDKQTGAPLANAHITLLTGVQNAITSVYGAMSDRSGHFSIATVRPGTYLLLCERPGYLHVQLKEAGMPNITLKPGQNIKDFKIEMTRRAILSGRVVDENGDPVQGALIESVELPPETVAFLQAINSSMERDRGTDDRGEFRISVAPGKYYLKAIVRGNAENPYGPGLSERRNDGSTAPPYSPTFYPSTVVKSRATPVEAVGGRDTGGLEIRLTRQQGLAINGVVSGIPESGSRVNVQLRQMRDGRNRVSSSRGNRASEDGKFSFNNLEPATYRIWATYRNGKTQLNSRMVEVRVESADPAPISLLLQPSAEVSGTVVMEGEAPGAAAPKRTVRIEGADGLSSGGETADTDGESNFVLAGVTPGKYRFHVDPLPDSGYVKSLVVDGVAVADNLFEIADGSRGARVKILVSRNGAQISGRVLDPDGNRLLTPIAMVGLMKGPDPSDTDSAEVGADTRYSFKNLRPGKYRLAGLNPFEMNIDDESSWFSKVYERAEEIEVKEGERLVKDVRVLAREDANAKKQ